MMSLDGCLMECMDLWMRGRGTGHERKMSTWKDV